MCSIGYSFGRNHKNLDFQINVLPIKSRRGESFSDTKQDSILKIEFMFFSAEL